MHLTFRPMTEADFPQAEAMKRATVLAATGDATLFDQWFTPERPLESHLKKLLAFDPASCVFAVLDNAIIGHIHLMIVEKGTCGYLNDIYLMAEHRGQSLGEQLHAYALTFFRKHGVSRALLRTNPHNPKLIAFYQRMGWTLGASSTHGLVWMERTLE